MMCDVFEFLVANMWSFSVKEIDGSRRAMKNGRFERMRISISKEKVGSFADTQGL
jgi:hypothetical protein